MTASLTRSHIGARQVRPLRDFPVAQVNDLRQLGIGLDEAVARRLNAAYFEASGMDSLAASVTSASMPTPVQFLQTWLPGFVAVITQARKIDELVGVTTVGSWEDEEIVQGVMEALGQSTPYGDATNVPLSSWNLNFERRTVVRFEEGMSVGKLETARSAKVRVDNAAQKRAAAALALEIQRNRVGFYGYNDGAGRTYGFLNDPNLPAYVGVAGGTWSTKTFLQITADLRAAFAALRTQSGDIIDPMAAQTTLAVATACVDFLTVTSDFGISVRDWLTQTYPRCRVVSAPELNAANGGANVFYLYAETVDDGASTDDNRTFVQAVPAKFQVLGVEVRAKATVEDYSNASAGILCKRPYAVVRRSGI